MLSGGLQDFPILAILRPTTHDFRVKPPNPRFFPEVSELQRNKNLRYLSPPPPHIDILKIGENFPAKDDQGRWPSLSLKGMRPNFDLITGGPPANAAILETRTRQNARRLLRQLLAVLLRPVTVFGNGFHRRAALGTAGARTFPLRLGHARTGLVLQAGADVNHVLVLRLILRVLAAAGGKKKQQDQGAKRNRYTTQGFHDLSPYKARRRYHPGGIRKIASRWVVTARGRQDPLQGPCPSFVSTNSCLVQPVETSRRQTLTLAFS